jgi:hypothetical protein
MMHAESRPSRGQVILRVTVGIVFLAWSAFVGVGVVSFLGSGRATSVTSSVGALAVGWAGVLAVCALAIRIGDGILEQARQSAAPAAGRRARPAARPSATIKSQIK